MTERSSATYLRRTTQSGPPEPARPGREAKKGQPLALPHFPALEDGRPLDLDRVLRALIDEVARQLDAERGTLYLVDQARGELVSRVAHLPELSEIRLRVGEGLAGWVARTGEIVRVPEGKSDPRFEQRIDQLTGFTTRSLIAVPVRIESEAEGGDPATVVGVLQVLNHRSGSFDAVDVERLVVLADEVARVLAQTSLRSQLGREQRCALDFRFNHIVGDSVGMREVYDRTARAARTEATVLVLGESGSGKEVIARAIHWNSPRHDAPFVKVDCAALPATLIENELFGHERGAFTGADRAAAGKVEAAEGGTLFLDEVGELPLEVQGKLLRLLQERTYMRVGSHTAVVADVRFVCATHRDLDAEVAQGRFRRDLLYRLRVVPIEVPPLRLRGPADLDRLTDHFLYEATRRHRRPNVRLSAAARRALHSHDWPGNVRELEHCIEAAVVLVPGSTIEPDLLPISRTAPLAGGAPETGLSRDEFRSPLVSLEALELAYLRHAVEVCGGNRSEAARRLGIGRNTLLRRLGRERSRRATPSTGEN